MVVDIALNRDEDNPQLIFESMNSTGRKLSQADLIRNFILMGLEPALQTRALRALLEADGGRLRTRARRAFRRLHASLPDGKDRARFRDFDEVYEAFKDHGRRPFLSERGY